MRAKVFRRSGISLILFLFFLSVQAQKKFTLNGYVKDTTSGESVIAATSWSRPRVTGES